MTKTMADLRDRLAQVEDLHRTAELLHWDQHTMMPPNGAGARANALATVARIAHERFIDAEIGRLLEGAEGELDTSDEDSEDVRMVRLTRRNWEKARRVPEDLAAEMAHAASAGHDAWIEARKASDFSIFAPQLGRNIELARRYIDCFDGFGGYECAYDVLLDDYDPGRRTADVNRLFADLKDQLVPLIAAVSEHSFENNVTGVEFPVAGQRQMVLEVLGRMGFEQTGWRLDDTVHPFATGIGHGDVRLTTRFDGHYFPTGLYSSMHECGHGLYSAGVATELDRTPLGELNSLSVHESQSRLWENMVGRSPQFCNWLAPRLAELSGGSLADLDGRTLYRVVNRVNPSLIRIEADETTYGMHIILRFELEQELIEGRLAIADLPEAWNARMREYLGVEVPGDDNGVLQDVHWAHGLIGYFPTYALGNLISGHLWQQIHQDLPDLDDQMAVGEFGALLGWLREHVHRHGAKFTSDELMQRVVGAPISVEPFVNYLKTKLSDVYGMELA